MLFCHFYFEIIINIIHWLTIIQALDNCNVDVCIRRNFYGMQILKHRLDFKQEIRISSERKNIQFNELFKKNTMRDN